MNGLKRLREERGVSQQTVASYLGITRQAYSNYENENRGIDNDTLLKLAEYFQVSADYILRGGPSAYSGPHPLNDDDLKFALWGDTDDIDDADLADVRRYAEFVRERKKKK